LACGRARQDLLDLGTLKPVWDDLYPAEQARIIQLLIERIDVAPDGMSVTSHAAGIRRPPSSWRATTLQRRSRCRPSWRLRSNGSAGGRRGRDPDHRHPDAVTAPRWPQADQDPERGGGAEAESLTATTR
jgi:hypothetical protein